MKATFLKGVVLGCVVSLVMLMATAAFAGSGVGAIFNLGKFNGVNGTTVLGGSTAGKQLSVVNTSNGTSAAGIGITVHSGKPPLVVDSSTKVKNLNADQLDGHNSSSFQSRVTGGCTHGTAISSVAASGASTCTTSSVVPIATSPASGGVVDLNPGASDLRLYFQCLDVSHPAVQFTDLGVDAATLNWMFSQGGTTSTVNATGGVVTGGTPLVFAASTNRLEGQWIYASPTDVVTVNLHAFGNGSTNCEFRGTAEVAAIG